MTAPGPQPRAGTGTCMAHHGELVQGSFPCGSRWVPALVTVPVPSLQARAVFEPEPEEGILADPEHVKAARAARLTLQWCGLRAAHLSGGRLRISSPIRPGCGMGSSTADVVASIRAVSSACGVRVSAREVCHLARRAEAASDPLAHGCTPVLFAQRHGRVLRRWHRPFPPVLLVGCRLPGPPVETLALGAPSYSAAERAEFGRILHLLERAVHTGDARLLGHVATRSALLNQTRLPKPELPDLLEVSRRAGGVGVQIAHSGTVCAVLVDAHRADAHHRARDVRAALDGLGLERTVDQTWRGA